MKKKMILMTMGKHYIQKNQGLPTGVKYPKDLNIKFPYDLIKEILKKITIRIKLTKKYKKNWFHKSKLNEKENNSIDDDMI